MRSPKNFPMLETCITPIAVLCLELADHRLISDKTIIYIVSMLFLDRITDLPVRRPGQQALPRHSQGSEKNTNIERQWPLQLIYTFTCITVSNINAPFNYKIISIINAGANFRA